MGQWPDQDVRQVLGVLLGYEAGWDLSVQSGDGFVGLVGSPGFGVSAGVSVHDPLLLLPDGSDSVCGGEALAALGWLAAQVVESASGLLAVCSHAQ